MPTPPETNKQGRPLEPCFTIEAPDSRNIFRASSWEELSSWWEAIEKYTISTLPPEAPQSPLSPRGVGLAGGGEFETLYPNGLDIHDLDNRSTPSSPTGSVSHVLSLSLFYYLVPTNMTLISLSNIEELQKILFNLSNLLIPLLQSISSTPTIYNNFPSQFLLLIQNVEFQFLPP